MATNRVGCTAYWPAKSELSINLLRKQRGTCEEAIALLWTDSDKVFAEGQEHSRIERFLGTKQEGFLDVLRSRYQVVEWSDSLVRAVARLPVADVDIQISPTRQTATRSNKEHADKSNRPVSSQYVLE